MEELEEFIRENLRYEPDTGHLYWTKPGGPRRRLDKPAGCLEEQGYQRVWFMNRAYRAHQIAWFLYYGRWPTTGIDHINGIKNDNRIENLREATHRQNGANRKAKGYYYRKGRGRYGAYIRANYKKIHLGYYDTEEEAQAAYRKATAKYFGEYAYKYENELTE